MQFKTITKHKLPFFVAIGLMAVLTSCGSFQYVGYDDDGIYSSEDYDTANVEQPVATTSTNDSDYYKNYFAENAAQIDAAMENSEIFTDIDSYEGNYFERAQDTIEKRSVYGGWGQNNESITINIIDNGWYGWNGPWLWNAGWGLGWNNWGWGRPWGWNSWGWNNWGWNAGWGFGWNNWGWNAGWGYGWNNWGWGPGWGYGLNNWGWNGYYRGNTYAFNAGRRGSLLSNNYLNRANRSTSALSRRNYSTSRLSRSATSSSASRSNSAIRTSRNGTIRNSSSTSNSRITRPSTSRSSGTIRSTGNSRSSSGSVRSTRSTRSSGSVRSSGSSSSRSSGSMRSSGSSRSSSSGSRSGGSSRRGRG
ncbi:MAG: hypothetical protein KDD26_05960 [Winogradskyella sp.]|nr:hypothetical protein [Winogradskyella sp.]